MLDSLAVVLTLAAPPTPLLPPVAAPVASIPSTTSKKVRLEDIVEHAREQASEALLSQAEIERGIAAQAGAKPLMPENPYLQLYTGARTNPNGSTWESQIQFYQAIYLAGQRKFQRKAANAERQALEESYERFQWQAEVETRTTFYLALLARRREESALTSAKFIEQVVGITRALVETGEESPLRLRLAQAELAQANAALIDAQYQYRAACNRLAQASGWVATERLEPDGELPMPLLDELSRPDDILAEHPLTRALQSRVRAANAAHEAARRDAWPHLSLGVYYGAEREPGAVRSHVTMASIAIGIPAWRRNQGGIANAQADMVIARNELFVVHRNLLRDLQRAMDGLVTSSARLKTYSEELLPRFSENLDLVRRAFELGEIDVLEVFVARSRFVDLQKQALDIYDDFIQAARAYELASGTRLQI